MKLGELGSNPGGNIIRYMPTVFVRICFSLRGCRMDLKILVTAGGYVQLKCAWPTELFDKRDKRDRLERVREQH